jgi:hypothetical protein
MNEPDQPEQTMGFRDLAPSDWTQGGKACAIWFAAYRAHRVPKDVAPTGGVVIDLGLVRSILTRAELQYFAGSGRIHLDDDGKGTLLGAPEVQRTQGAHLLLLTPFVASAVESPEAAVRDRIAEAVAVHAAVLGRNIVYERVFEQLVDPQGQVTFVGPGLLNPFHLPAPAVDAGHFAHLKALDSALLAQPPDVRERLRLALRWYTGALGDHGVDAYLKFWISLEIMAMPSTEIQPVNQHLARAYGMPLAEVQETFAVGRLFGLRSRIVHKGWAEGLDGLLLDYLEAVVGDVLCAVLNQPCLRKAEPLAGRARDLLTKALRPR